MIVITAVSAPESLGGSLAALAIYDIVRSRIPKTLAVTGDPLGILYRTFAHRDLASIPLDPQPSAGVTIAGDLEGVSSFGRTHGADAVVFDATGDLARDVRAWPDQLHHLVAGPFDGHLFVIMNDSQGARYWVDYLATNHPDTFKATTVLSYPIGGRPRTMSFGGKSTLPVPFLHRDARSRLEETGLAPSALIQWDSPDRRITEHHAIAAWIDAWTALLAPILNRYALS